MKFEWDELKAHSNFSKHQIRFEEAQTVFLDTRAIEFFDVEHSNYKLGEDRFIRIGISSKMRMLIVVFCELEESCIRLISARHAKASERRVYEERI